MRDLSFDLRYTLRSLRRGWRFALGVILTLGLGIGLGVPVMSLADHFFLRPPPGVADPDRVVRLMLRGFGSQGPYVVDGLTGLDYRAFTTRATTLDGVAGWTALSLSLGRGTDARMVSTILASPSYFPVLGVRPYLGRFYLESEDVEGVTDAPCVVSYQFWQRSLGASRDALGRASYVGSTRYTVVGVAPEGFNGLGFSAVDMWLPLHVATPEFQGHDPELWTTDHSAWMRIVARVRPSASLAAATTEAAYLYGTSGPRTRDRDLKGTMFWDPLEPGRSSMPNRSATIALWLSGGGMLLLLLVVANLVNLFVARAAADARQIAVRLAIGGSWHDLFRVRVAESLVLGASAAMLGLVVAFPAVRAGRALLMPGVTWVRPAIDARVALLTFGIAIVVGAIIAAWTTAFATRVDPADLMRSAGTTQMSGTRRSHAARRVLLVAQAAIFVVLLTGAAAFVTSLRRASRIDFGFDAASVIAARIPLPASTSRERAREVYQRAYERVSALPEVESASLAYMEPWSNNTSVDFMIPGSTAKPPWTLFDVATPDYLRTMGTTMRRGRWFEPTDRASSPFVVVVNETFEKTFWPAANAIGHCARVGAGADTMPCRTVVGVVRDFHVTGGADEAPRPVYYVPLAQAAMFAQTPHLFFRARGDRGAAMAPVRRAIQGTESNLPAIDIHPVSQNVAWLTSTLALGASAFTAFGLLAAIVAAIGLYSVLSYLVIEQQRGHAIRVALGARPARVARTVAESAIVTVGVGAAIGLVSLIPLARVFDPLLFHATVLEPATVAVVVTLAAIVAVTASLAPVRMVLRADPMTVLREQ